MATKASMLARQEGLRVAILHLQSEMKFATPPGNKFGCKTCDHYRNGLCELVQQVPPPDVVAELGCPQWSFDGIPF